MKKFIQHQDYEKTYRELTVGDSLKSFFLNKSKAQKRVFKEHVSVAIYKYFSKGSFTLANAKVILFQMAYWEIPCRIYTERQRSKDAFAFAFVQCK